jgi:DNA-binding response OmpR family regulator
MFFWKKKPEPARRTLSDLKDAIVLPLEEAKRRAKILVIDDDPAAFPVELLRDEGYNIQQWEELKTVRNLEQGQFDIIVLDIHGICAEGMSKTDGLGVLEHLKSVNPAQIVIAYSGKKFDLQHEKFWRIADDYLGKPTDMLVAKAKLDALLREKFTADHYWKTLVSFLRTRGLDSDRIQKLETAVTTAVETKKELSETDIRGLLSAGKDIISTAWIIVQVIQRFAS